MATETVIRRRRLLALAVGACGWGLTGRLAAAPVAGGRAGRLWLSAYATADASPRFGVAAFDGQGRLRFSCPLPGRAHGVAPHPDGTHAVVMARRPGRWLAVVDLKRGGLRGEPIELPVDRRGTGHGVFDAAGNVFYHAEDDIGRERGALALLDPSAGYKRIGEIPDVGVGPHEVLALGDGKTLVVADGGVLTHPDVGRAKLNLDAMDPALLYLDAQSGKTAETLRLPKQYGNLGIRHVAATDDGAVVFGMQDERPSGEIQPLVGMHRRGETLRLLDAPETVWRRLSGYVGSVACNGGLAAASSPRGGVVATWNAATGVFVGLSELPDGCGLAPGPEGGFVASSGFGRIVGLGSDVETAGRRWDNHLSAALFTD